MKLKPFPRFLYAVVLCSGFTTFQSHAVTRAWVGGASNLWSTNGNWSGNPRPGTGDTAIFNAASANTTVSLGGGVTIANLSFTSATAAAYTIGAGAVGNETLTLDGSGSVTMAADTGNSQRIHANLLLSNSAVGSYALTNSSTARDLTFAGTIQGGTGGSAGVKTLNLGGAGNLFFNGVIGTGGATSVALATAAGTGTVTLSAANTYAGGTTLGGGTVALGNNAALGSGAVTISAASTIRSNDATARTLANALVVNASTTFGSAATGNLLFSNTVNAGAAAGTTSFVINNGQTEFSGVVSGSTGTMDKAGSGTLVLSGNNSYSRNTTITGGALNIRHANALGSASAGTSVTSGAALQLQGGIIVGAEALTLNGSGIGNTGALHNVSDNNTYGGAITLGSASRIDSASGILTLTGGITGGHALTVGGAGSTQINGIIGGGGALTKEGNGTLTLNAANTYNGVTAINAGTLALSASGSIANSSEVSLGGGTFDVSAKAGYIVSSLSGTGNVAGVLTVSDQLAIGNSTGAVVFSNNLILDSARHAYEVTGGGSSADLATVAGNLIITTGSVLDVIQLGTYTAGDKFTLFAYSGTQSGIFDGKADDTDFTAGGGLWRINYNDTTAGLNGGTGLSFVTINALGDGFTQLPEPASALLGCLGGALLLLRRRRAS